MKPYKNIKVNPDQLTIVVEKVKVPLTLDVAKQIPIIWNDEKILSKCHPLPMPICKVLKETIADPERDEAFFEDQQIEWFFLIDVPGIGVAWMVLREREGECAKQQGINSEREWVDHLEQVKTVILE